MSDSAPSPEQIEQPSAQGGAAEPPPVGDTPPAETGSPETQDAGVEPPGGGAATPGAEAPAARITQSEPVPEGAVKSVLVETPTQGAAVENGEPIPDVSAEPVQPVSTPEAVAVEHNAYPEHPGVTVQRLRTKLAAYGEECLKSVQGEVEYLLKLIHGE